MSFQDVFEEIMGDIYYDSKLVSYCLDEVCLVQFTISAI